MIFSRKVKQEELIDKIREPFQVFFKQEASGGILLLIFTAIALVIANSSFADVFTEFWKSRFVIGYPSVVLLDKPLILWVNDGLMAIFFFVVGLEIKREIMVGELASFKKASLPISAAIGGMVIPAALFFLVNNGLETKNGWGIPMATDIAFALGVLSLQGKRASLSLKIFLTALAIVDDLGAVMVIAIFYTSQIATAYLLIGAGIVALLVIINIIGIKHPFLYIFFGVFLWLAFLKSGVHTTIAGVLLALTIPARSKINRGQFIRKTQFYLDKFKEACGKGKSLLTNKDQQDAVQSIEVSCHKVESPMQRMEHNLHPFVIFLIMPIFALANAGVSFNSSTFMQSLTDPLSIGIIAGLFLGKPIGIFIFSYIAVKSGLADLPGDIKWRQIIGVGFLAGIGFTMSLFISGLAYANSPYLDIAKIGILTASIISGIIGWILLSKK